LQVASPNLRHVPGSTGRSRTSSDLENVFRPKSAPGRLLVDQAKKSHLGLYTVLSELSANTKLAWRGARAGARHSCREIPFAPGTGEPNSRAGSFFIRDRGRMRNPEIILMVPPLSGR
jgi:hypothetical protein